MPAKVPAFNLAMALVAVVLEWTAIALLWGWFVVPTFHVAPIGIPVALGLLLLRGSSPRKKDPDQSMDEFLLSCVISQVLIIGFGYIAHLFA